MEKPDAPDLPRSLRDLLKRILRDEADAPAILFSGGLDSAVLAFLASRLRPLAAITVSVGGGSRDEEPAARAAKMLGLTHILVKPSFDDLLRVLPQTVKLLETFDPAVLRNALPQHAALLTAREMHFPAVLTGDGADELFAGYAFFHSQAPQELKASLRRLWKTMTFGAAALGRRLEVSVQSPYLHPQVRALAEKAPPRLLVGERNGRRHGKVLLRQALEGDLPEDILWREKCPAETGSGSAGLTGFFEAALSTDEFKKEAEAFARIDKVKIRDKEHLYYYKLYRSQFGPPRRAPAGRRACPDCGAALSVPEADFCGLCGAWALP